MIRVIDIPAEQTTAATDALLAVVTLVCLALITSFRIKNRWKTGIWAWLYGLLAAAALLGTVVHGFQMPDGVRNALWQPLYLSLGLTVALFVVGVVHDWKGERTSKRVLPFMIAIGFGFHGITLVMPGTFLVFILYESVSMLFAMAVYTWLWQAGRLPGAGLMALGILTSIIAAGVQAVDTLTLTLVWVFDHNGLFHIIQIPGVILLTLGLRKSFRHPSKE